MSSTPKFRIAIIGSGPVGKLMIASVASHPRISFSQYEAETLPLRPSFGYGVGPQTLTTTKILNPAIGDEILKQSIVSPVWMHFLHSTDESIQLPAISVPEGVYGRLGREELMKLLDDFAPAGHQVKHGMKAKAIKSVGGGEVKVSFEDGTEEVVNAVWACDGMNSLGRRVIQGEDYKPALYSGMICFRGKVEDHKVTAAVGKDLATKTHMFIGGPGYFVLVFPIAGGKYVNIAAFTQEKEFKKPGRFWKTGLDDMLAYFPEANPTLRTLLGLVYEEPDCQRLDLMRMEKLGTFFNKDLCMTSFGDAANGMLPHMAGSMSTGFIGVTTFLHEELNPRIRALAVDASDAEIAKVLADASIEYEKKHRPLAQKLCDYSNEQGGVFSGRVLDVDELQKRPRFLWQAASSQL